LKGVNVNSTKQLSDTHNCITMKFSTDSENIHWM